MNGSLTARKWLALFCSRKVLLRECLHSCAHGRILWRFCDRNKICDKFCDAFDQFCDNVTKKIAKNQEPASQPRRVHDAARSNWDGSSWTWSQNVTNCHNCHKFGAEQVHPETDWIARGHRYNGEEFPPKKQQKALNLPLDNHLLKKPRPLFITNLWLRRCITIRARCTSTLIFVLLKTAQNPWNQKSACAA